MARKISIILMLTIFALSLFGASAFAAKAKSAGTAADVSALKAVSHQQVMPRDVAGLIEQPAGSTKPSGSVMQSLGFMATNGIVNTGQVTEWDFPSWRSQPREIVQGTAAMACPNRITVVWRSRPLGGGTQFIQAANYLPGGSIASAAASGDGAGYPGLAITAPGIPVTAYHNALVDDSLISTYAAREFTCGANDYAEVRYPDTANVNSGPFPTEGMSDYLWPQIAADVDGGGNWFVHVIAHESPNDVADTSGYQSLLYWRSVANSAAALGTIGTVLDTVEWPNGTITASPVSQNVAVIYGRPRVFSPVLTGSNDDIYYRESTNLGVSWGTATAIKVFPTTMDPKFAVAAARERFEEANALYTADGCLHVLFVGAWVDTTANSYYPYPAKLYHWNKCNIAATNIVTETYIAASNCAIGGGGTMRGIGKVSLTECSGKLYASFSKSLSTEGDDVLPDFHDCSSGGKFTNFEIIIKASSTDGATWGPDSNVTNTHNDLCAAGSCRSELSIGAVERTTDSVRVAYFEDKDPGIYILGDVGAVATNNPIKIVSVGCFNMATFQSLSSTPSEVRYPFRTVPAGIKDTAILLTNSGNVPSPYVTSITYLSGSGWLAFGGTQGPVPSGTVTAGAVATENIGIRATGPVTEGFYQAEVKFTYDSGTKVVTIPVDLYNFTSWKLPKNVSIRTSLARINVNQASEIADSTKGRAFSYFSDTSDYMYDGFLIIGNSANNLSYSTFHNGGGGPSVTNPFGYTYAASDSMTSDSTTFGGYRYATGKGYNRDSTLEFTSDYWAPKHPDSANFFVLRYSIYHGPKDTGTAITGLHIAYYADMDVPADTGSDNIAGWDTTLTGSIRRASIYQQGTLATSPASNQNRFLALGGAIDRGFAPLGGFVTPNPTYIYPESGWENDSLWNWLSNTSLIPAPPTNGGGKYVVVGPHAAPSGTPEDLSTTLLLQRGAQVRSKGFNDTLKVTVLVAGTPKTGSLTVLNQTMDRAYKFMRTNKLRFCRCGDADGNNAISISDAVKTINFIFAGGSAPNPLCRGDADGNGSISISDAVKLINFIFGGGLPPEKC